MIKDWASFFFIGANVLPIFIVLAGQQFMPHALIAYTFLISAAAACALADWIQQRRKPAEIRRDDDEQRRR